MNKQHWLKKFFWATGLSMVVVGALASCAPLREEGPQSDEVVGQAVALGSGGEDVVIGLTYVPNVQFAPVYMAGADEVFRAAGIGANLRHHGPDEGLFTALTTGEEDVVVASGDEVLQARAAGMDLVSIGSYYDQYPVVIVVKEDSDIHSVADLQGKRVGIPGEFGSSWFGLLAALDAADMEAQDVQVVPIGFTQAASLASGQVEAVVGFVNSDVVQLEALDVPVRVIPLAEDDVPLVGASIVTTREWAEKHPKLAAGVVAAINTGKQRVINNPQRAMEVTSNWDPSLQDQETRENAHELLLATIPLWENEQAEVSAEQDLERWREMAPFLARVLDLDLDQMDVDGAVTNDYLIP